MSASLTSPTPGFSTTPSLSGNGGIHSRVVRRRSGPVEGVRLSHLGAIEMPISLHPGT